jgi:glutathione S-transferase
MKLYGHPFSSYSWKVLIALYENATPFEDRPLTQDKPQNYAELSEFWPHKKFPVLADNGQALIESSIIIEYLDRHYPGKVKFIPDGDAGLEVRFLDRFFDNYVMTPMMRIVSDFIRKPVDRDAITVADAKAMLETSYRWIDEKLANRKWAAGDTFTLADCAAAPSLFYADWVHPIPEELRHTRGYRTRLLAHPSVKRAVDEARPYRTFFPPGAPDRD